MIIEHEILEQLADSSADWPLSRALEFIARHKEPWPVLQALYRDGCMVYRADGSPAQKWEVEEMFRSHNASCGEVIVRVTQRGIGRAFPDSVK